VCCWACPILNKVLQALSPLLNFLFLKTREQRLRRVRQRLRAFVDLVGDKGQEGDARGRWAMATLTYRDIQGWRPNHIRAFLKLLRQDAHRKGFPVLPYVWVAELQERGAVHYHVMVKLPKGYKMPKPDLSFWHHGCSEVSYIRRSGRGYMSKYASKLKQKIGDFPAGLRLCGAGGLSLNARRWWTWLLSPSYVRKETDPVDCVRRVAGGWQSNRGFLPSPWRCMPCPDLGGVLLQRKPSDQWASAAIESRPLNRFYLLDRAYREVESWVLETWHQTGKLFQNPWEPVNVFV